MPATARRRSWTGETGFAMLSYQFALRWNWAPIGEHVRGVLAAFETTATPDVPSTYSLIRTARASPRRFRVLLGDDELGAFAGPAQCVNHLLWHVNAEAIGRTGEWFLVHCGAVATPGGDGVLLPGPSGAGKTTLVGALVRAGYGYLSDEAGCIDPIGRRLHPYPKPLTVKRKSFAIFEDVQPAPSPFVDGHWHVSADAIRQGSAAGACDVRYVIATRFEKDAPARLEPISAGQAAIELGRNALNLRLYGARALPLLAGVASSAKAFRLRWGDVREAVRVIGDVTAAARITLSA